MVYIFVFFRTLNKHSKVKQKSDVSSYLTFSEAVMNMYGIKQIFLKL